MRGHRTSSGESGSALVEFCWVGVILFVPMIWIIISVFAVQRGAFAVDGAARAAARAYALAPDDATGEARAKAVVDQALLDQAPPGMKARTWVTCTPYEDACHTGTSLITVHIDSAVEIPFLPSFLAPEEKSFNLDAAHTVPIGQFVAVPDGVADNQP